MKWYKFMVHTDMYDNILVEIAFHWLANTMSNIN